MTEPPSPTSSSTYSCISDSDSGTSNDSGIESISSGSFPPDYMDIDEFLIATGVKNFNPASPNNLVQSFVSQCQKNKLSQQYKQNSEQKNEIISDTKEKKSKTQLHSKEDSKEKETKPKSLTKKRQADDYSYKYNPLPMGKKAKRKFVSDDDKDEKYWKRRIRNNEAARRSRDMRRQREIEISAKWKELERENERLRRELQKLKDRASELEKQLLEKHSQ